MIQCIHHSNNQISVLKKAERSMEGKKRVVCSAVVDKPLAFQTRGFRLDPQLLQSVG